jgi:hypothetical protein
VHTPVGARCRECANLRKLPQYTVSPAYLARAVAAAVGAGALLGVAWGIIVPFSFLGLLAGLGVGYAVGESVSWSTNRKAGTTLQMIAVGGMIIAFLARDAVLASAIRGIEIQDLVRSDTFGWLATIVGAFVAAGRLR